MIKEAIIKIVTKQDLTFSEAETVMNEIMSGKTTATQNAAFLAALSTKSTKAETIDEISGCAVSMRSHATPVEHPGMDVLEIVGTGGDNANTFNISTTSAMVIAAAGVFRTAWEPPSKENEMSPCLRENGSAKTARARSTVSNDNIFFIRSKMESGWFLQEKE